MLKMKLSEMCLGITDGSHNPPDGIEKSDFLMISSKNIYDDKITLENPRYLSQDDFISEDKRTQIEPGDVLLTIVGTVGRSAVVDEDIGKITLQRSVAVLHTNYEICSSRYLMYLLQSKRFYLEHEARGVAQKGIYLKQLSNMEVAITDKNNQDRIVKMLDEVNGLIKLCQEQIEAYDGLIKSRFVELFGNCSRYEKLEKYALLITKGASPKWQGIEYTDSGTLFVTSENVREGYLDFEKRKYVDNKINEIQPRSVLQENDVLINIVGASIGRAAVYRSTERANINQAVALVRVDMSQLNLQYLILYLNSAQALESYEKMKKGGARDNLSLKNITDLLIPVPSIEQQEQFAAIVDQIDKLKVAEQKRLEKLQLLFDSLMQQYFG